MTFKTDIKTFAALGTGVIGKEQPQPVQPEKAV